MRTPNAFFMVSCILAVSCNSAQNTLYSKNYSKEEKIETLKKHITAKSRIEWAEFMLFDVNMNNRSVPGASGKQYRAVIKVNPKDAHLWVDGKEGWLTSFPHSMEWIELILDDEQKQYMRSMGYFTYHKEEPGMRYTVWVNEENGVIVLEYVEE